MPDPTDMPQESPDEQGRRFYYRGISMHPTFKTGHLLYLRPEVKNLRLGDVIVYDDPAQKKKIVHRIVRIEGTSIYTRGDNNPQEDVDPVLLNQVIGKVAWVDHYGQPKPVLGGNLGLSKLYFQAARKRLLMFSRRLLSPLYQCIKKLGLIKRFWKPEIKKISIMTDTGAIIKYVHKNQTVAVYHTSTEQFLYRYPYEMIIEPPQNKKNKNV